MSRKVKKDLRRPIEPDPIYSSLKVSKFINRLMQKGKKNTARTIVYGALKRLSQETGLPEVEAFETVLKNVIPQMEVRSRRVGGSTYQVPMEVRQERGLALAMRWIIGYSRSRSGKSMIEKLSSEFIDAFNKSGSSVKKREDTHKMAEANKAFAHFRW